MNRLREELVKAGGAGVTATALGPTAFQLAGVAARAGRRAAPGRDRGRGDLQPRVGRGRHVRVPHEGEHRQPDSPGDGGAGDPHHRAPRQRARRRRAHRRASGRPGSDPGAAAGRERRRAREGDHQVDVAARADAGRGRTGQHARAVADGDRRQRAVRRRGAAGRRAVGAGPGAGGVVYYLVKKTPVVSGRDLRNARPDASTRTTGPAVGFSLKPDGASRFGTFTGRNIGRNLAIVLDERVVFRARHRGTDQRRRPHRRQLHAAGSQRPVADAALGRAAGVADVSRGAHRRSVARRRLDSRRHHGVAHRPRRWSTLFMLAYYKLSGINADRRRWPSTCWCCWR